MTSRAVVMVTTRAVVMATTRDVVMLTTRTHVMLCDNMILSLVGSSGMLLSTIEIIANY